MQTQNDSANACTAENSQMFYIVNLSHTARYHAYITFWRPENCGYAWPLCWAGKYPREAVMAKPGYYNTGSNVAVPCEIVDALAVPPTPGEVDNDAGPVVLNNRENWKTLLAAVIQQPKHPMVPVYKGARGKSDFAYARPTAVKGPPSKDNTLVVHDSLYVMTKSYLAGALAMRRSIPWSCNPHRDGSQANQDWDYGHVHESAGEHVRFGVDVINAPRAATCFKMDDAVPRMECGDVEDRWYEEQLASLEALRRTTQNDTQQSTAAVA